MSGAREDRARRRARRDDRRPVDGRFWAGVVYDLLTQQGIAGEDVRRFTEDIGDRARSFADQVEALGAEYDPAGIDRDG